MSQIETSWARCWQGLRASGNGVAVRERLTTAYREPHRKYHTTQHLVECLSAVEPMLASADHPAEVEMALWFHDAVYDLRAANNEAKSAEWAETELAAAGVESPSVTRVVDHILATRHKALPVGNDQKLLVDVDLSILGAPRSRFLQYEEQVREEYRWVPMFLYRRKRRGILGEFLARDAIYQTPVIRDRLEHQARANLQFSVQHLGG